MTDKIVDLTAIIERNKSTYELVEQYVLPNQYILANPQMKVDSVKTMALEGFAAGDIDAYKVYTLAGILSDLLKGTHTSFDNTTVLSVRKLRSVNTSYSIELSLIPKEAIPLDADAPIPPRIDITVLFDKLNDDERLDNRTLTDLDSFSIKPIRDGAPKVGFVKQIIRNLCEVVEGSSNPGYVHISPERGTAIAGLHYSKLYAIFVCMVLNDYYKIEKPVTTPEGGE